MSVEIEQGFPTPTPKPFTEEEYEQWAASAAVDDQQFREGLRGSRSGLWRAAEAAYRFHQSAGWLALGYDTLGEYLADPDITLSRRTFFRMTQAWQEMVVLRQVDAETIDKLDLTKVSIALPALKSGEAQVEDVIADVESLAARDLREKYTTPKTVPAEDPEPVDDPELHPPDVIEGHADDVGAEHLYGDEQVPRGIAKTLYAVLQAIYREVGAPERKAMSNRLREQIEYALELAQAEGLADV